MGIYIYSLRAKTVALVVPSGEKVRANLYSYAYRYTSYWKGDPGERSYNLIAENTVRRAEKAFNDPRSGYVIMGDMEQGLDGSSVYTNVTAATYYDTDRFPGTLIGFVRKDGKRYEVTDRTNWTTGKACRDGVWVNIRTRSRMIDGKYQYESEDVIEEAA